MPYTQQYRIQKLLDKALGQKHGRPTASITHDVSLTNYDGQKISIGDEQAIAPVE